MKRTIRVTIIKEIEVEFTPGVFGPMTEAEYLAEFRKGLWHVDSIDDVFKYAASMAACYSTPAHHDGLGLMNDSGLNWPRRGDTLVRELAQDIECEIIDGGAA